MKVGVEAKSAALARECRSAEVERIAFLLTMPMRERMNFLRVRLPGGGSVL